MRLRAELRHRHEGDDSHPHDSAGHSHQHDSEPAGHSHHHHEHHSHPSAGSAVDPEAHRTPLARGAGRGHLLHFDAFSGVAGDMCVAALVDLGVPFAEVQSAVAALELPGVELSLKAQPAGAIGATKFDVLDTQAQPQRTYSQIRQILENAALPEGAKALSQRIFARLARAESTVHRVPLDDVHFHEVGAVDSIVDIVAAAVCLDFIDASVTCSALPMGRGMVRCQHGMVPIPAPATLLCLDRLQTVASDLEAELVTPTGAAIVGEVAEPATWPNMRPLRAGWGRGTRNFLDRPNALRAVLGVPASQSLRPGLDALEPVPSPTHFVVESNLDDVTGETLGFVIAALLDAGALDAWASPITMKKGRPAWTLHALASAAQCQAVTDVMLSQSSAIGVRTAGVFRAELPRSVREVNTAFGRIPVKFSGDGGARLAHAKPEFDVCARLALEHGVPVRQVLLAALAAAQPDTHFSK